MCLVRFTQSIIVLQQWVRHGINLPEGGQEALFLSPLFYIQPFVFCSITQELLDNPGAFSNPL